jgi:hypothetical protein
MAHTISGAAGGLTPAQVGARLGVSTPRIYQMAAAGLLVLERRGGRLVCTQAAWQAFLARVQPVAGRRCPVETARLALRAAEGVNAR